MTKKVLKIKLDGCYLECIKTEGIINPFRVYKVAAGRRRQIAKYGDFFSVICFLKDFYREGADTMTTPDVIVWAKERGSIF